MQSQFNIKPHSKSLLYIAQNSPNLWKQRIDGGPPKQMTFCSFEET
jgi:hypothetical protein